MVSEPEILTEKWFTFFRYHCKEGFIDKWVGDQINDPNKDEKSNYQLNSFKCYFRLNGTGKWFSRNEMNWNLFSDILNCKNSLSSQEIWDMNTLNEQVSSR